MNNKYEMLENDTIVHGGTILHRIRALQDFGKVKAGNIGGYIEKVENLDTEGKAWVSGNARVYGDARVTENAQETDG